MGKIERSSWKGLDDIGNSFGLYFDQAFEQVMHAVSNFFAGIVSGGNGIGALLYGIVKKHLNLISALHKISGFGVRPALYSLRK